MNGSASDRGISREAAVISVLGLFASNFPAIAGRLDPADTGEARRLASAWLETLEGFNGPTILEGARRMLKRMASETNDIAPTGPRLRSYCAEVAREVPKAPPVPVISAEDMEQKAAIADRFAGRLLRKWGRIGDEKEGEA